MVSTVVSLERMKRRLMFQAEQLVNCLFEHTQPNKAEACRLRSGIYSTHKRCRMEAHATHSSITSSAKTAASHQRALCHPMTRLCFLEADMSVRTLSRALPPAYEEATRE